MKSSSLCYLIKDGQVLLAMKKRDFGMGKWNGVGGKVSPGETIEETALRELNEEIGITARTEQLESMGVIHFHSENEKYNWDSHLFFLRSWEGEPQETEEVRPQWYSNDSIPYDDMWLDDKHWFPLVLAGKKVEGEFWFDKEGKEILKFTIKEVQ